MKNILFDCDDILLNWLEGFMRHLEIEHGITGLKEEDHTWHMGDWTGLGDKLTFQEIVRFNEESEHFAELKPIPGAVEAIQEFHRMGLRMSVITSCSEKAECIDRRQRNLMNVFGDVFDDIHCVPIETTKESYLKKYEPSFWFEDNVKNAIMGHSIGHKAVIRKLPHNLPKLNDTPPGISWVDSWTQFRAIVREHATAAAA